MFGRRWGYVAMLVAVAALALGGCIPTGPTYPVDFYHEMHYTQMYRAYEPPRLAPPDEAVPTTGRAPRYTAAEAAQLRNPLQPTPANLERARALYRRDCATCHGAEGKGNGIISAYFQTARAPTPVDFASERVRNRTDGEVWHYIGQGIGLMPPFENLLGEEERWLLVLAIREMGGPGR
ncbi:MAG: cytochrome c [Chloroflexi bacterium]|nr:cytochrome c [Chloroflexota bacterium]